MKTLKDFKNELTPGSRWLCYNSLGWKNYPTKEVIREVARKQSNAVTFKGPNDVNECWLYWPKASQVTFINNGGEISVRVENEAVPGEYLIYKKAV
jgi:hypothetical protein